MIKIYTVISKLYIFIQKHICVLGADGLKNHVVQWTAGDENLLIIKRWTILIHRCFLTQVHKMFTLSQLTKQIKIEFSSCLWTWLKGQDNKVTTGTVEKSFSWYKIQFTGTYAHLILSNRQACIHWLSNMVTSYSHAFIVSNSIQGMLTGAIFLIMDFF